jgi:predicted PurR-regulated permease PerM
MAFQTRESLQHSELELFAWKVGVVIAAAIALLLLWAARDVLILIFIAAVLAAGISPAVHRVRVWGRHLFHKHIPRGTAVLIVYLPFLVIAIALLIFMVPRLVDDTRALSAQLPALLERMSSRRSSATSRCMRCANFFAVASRCRVRACCSMSGAPRPRWHRSSPCSS